MTRIAEIEGVGAASAQKLNAAGIKTVEALLDKGATAKGRKEIAKKSGISEKLILEWVNLADLQRISGVGGQYSDLLEAAGADTVPEMAARNAANLRKKLEEVNAAKMLVRKLPTEAQIADWIAQAKKLPRMVSH